MLVIGLCGGSGSGKSTVAGMLSSRNILHVDTDLVYRKLISSPSECTYELASEFGDLIINGDGSVNRRILAEIVFSDKNKHTKLNHIAHKHVLNLVRDVIKCSSGYLAVCVDAPMLFESGFDRECDLLVAVLAPIEKRIERITARDNISIDDAIKRINAQISDRDLISKVDFVINNSGDMSALEEQIDALINYINNNFK